MKTTPETTDADLLETRECRGFRMPMGDPLDLSLASPGYNYEQGHADFEQWNSSHENQRPNQSATHDGHGAGTEVGEIET